MKNRYWIISGLLNLLTAIVHTIGGQIDLVNPLMSSDLTTQAKTEWLGAWHAITVLLFLTSYYLLTAGFGKSKTDDLERNKFIGIFYLLFGCAFILASLWMKTLAPQFIILLPIGILTLLGLRKSAS